MKNEFIFLWLALSIGWMDNVEQAFRILSLAVGSIVGIITIIRFFQDRKNKKNQ